MQTGKSVSPSLLSINDFKVFIRVSFIPLIKSTPWSKTFYLSSTSDRLRI